MNEFPENNPPGGELPELRGVIATVGVVSAAGATLIFPGQTEATSKPYKRLDTGQALAVGNTVLAVKMNGTYVIIGKLI